MNPTRIRTSLALALAGCVLTSGPGGAQQSPEGAWGTTSDCFLQLLELSADGTAHVAYVTGEEDFKAKWTLEGMKLSIVSSIFYKDVFSGDYSGDSIDVDYTWHNNDDDTLHTEMCSFARAVIIDKF